MPGYLKSISKCHLVLVTVTWPMGGYYFEISTRSIKEPVFITVVNQ